jgi:hypothetical protein
MNAVQLFFLARDQGEIGNASMLERAAEQRPDSLYPQAMLALALLESGATEAAVDKLTLLDGDNFRKEQESSWAAVLALFSEIVAAGREPRHAQFLYELLEPFGGRLVSAVLGLACLGAADRYLGMLSATFGDWESAATHFDRALVLEERIRGTALVLRTRYWQAWSLRARGRAEDDARARTIAAGVVEEARELGMHRLSSLAAEVSKA